MFCTCALKVCHFLLQLEGTFVMKDFLGIDSLRYAEMNSLRGNKASSLYFMVKAYYEGLILSQGCCCNKQLLFVSYRRMFKYLPGCLSPLRPTLMWEQKSEK